MKHPKSWKNHSDQLDQLIERGLIVTDRARALDYLERIEIALRAEVAHKLGEQDPFAYLKPELFYKGFSVELNKNTGVTEHHEWLSKHARLIGRSKEEFIRHNRYKYGLPSRIDRHVAFCF